MATPSSTPQQPIFAFANALFKGPEECLDILKDEKDLYEERDMLILAARLWFQNPEDFHLDDDEGLAWQMERLSSAFAVLEMYSQLDGDDDKGRQDLVKSVASWLSHPKKPDELTKDVEKKFLECRDNARKNENIPLQVLAGYCASCAARKQQGSAPSA